MSKYPIKIQSDLLLNMSNYSAYDPSMGDWPISKSGDDSRQGKERVGDGWLTSDG